MRAFRVFLVLFILSLMAWGATVYWTANSPDGPVAQENASASGQAGTGTAKAVAPAAARKATRLQDLANQLSIGSSVVSAAGALISAFFSFARYRQQRRIAAK